MTEAKWSFLAPFLAAALLFGAPAVTAHEGKETLPDGSDDPYGGFSLVAGLPCDRTDIASVELTPVHESTFDGTRITFRLAELSEPCPTEGDRELFEYRAVFSPANHERVDIRLAVDESLNVEWLRVLLDDGDGSPTMLSCDGGECASVDTVSDTISYRLGTDVAEDPFERAYFTAEMDRCYVSVCFGDEFVDRAPDLGRTSFFGG